jgi:hypothetical protein
MFLLINPSKVKNENIIFLEKKKNIIMYGYFSQISFSNNFMTMNGLSFKLPSVINYSNFLTIDTVVNLEWIKQISCIENQILNYYYIFNNLKNKNPIYTLKTKLFKGILKYYRTMKSINKHCVYYLKISGVWEDNNEIGLTFKVMEQ